MKRHHCVSVVLVCAIGLGFSRMARTAPLVTIRVTSINEALRDMETISASTHTPSTRSQMLASLSAALGVQDLSFLDLSQPAAFVMPQEGMMLGAKGFVMAIPVRDGMGALDVLAKQFAERTLDGDLTVLRQAPVEMPWGTVVQETWYAALRGRVLVLGQMAELVRSFDHATALSGENLPPGSLAFSLEIEPVAALLKGSLTASRQKLMEMNAQASPAKRPAAVGAAGAPAPGTATRQAEGGSIGADQPSVTGEGAGGSPGAAAEDKPVLVEGEVSPPELLDKVVPDYPVAARRAHVQGKVVLEAIIDKNGDVQNVRVLRSIPELDGAALEAVGKWKYKPALHHGQPVKVFFTVVVDFTLRDDNMAPAPDQASAPLLDPKKLAPIIDLYFGFLGDTIDSLSKAQVSIEVSDGFLIMHGRGVARQGSTLAGFIAAQRDVGLPAVGRMMPARASVIVAGQVYWTDPSRTWLKQFLQRYQSAMGAFFNELPESEHDASETVLQGMKLWSSDRIIDCQRGDLALAMDSSPDGMRMLQVWGLSDSEKCRGALASTIATSNASSGNKAFVETDVLQPEKVTTYLYQIRPPKTLGESETTDPGGMKIRFAEIGDIVVSGTDEWASKAIREAASAREGSLPGGGGLVLTDLGPFTQRPGIFGRMQLGTLMRQAQTAAAAKAQQRREAPPEAKSAGKGRTPPAGSPSRDAAPTEDVPVTPETLLQELEGQAGAIPFAMRFDEGAATLEIALPLAMLDAFAKNAPKPAAPTRGKGAPPMTPQEH